MPEHGKRHAGVHRAGLYAHTCRHGGGRGPCQNAGVGFEVALLPMDGDKELRPHQGVDDFQLLYGVGDVGAVVLRDRQHLAQDGMVVVVVSMSGEDGAVISGRDIITRGFVYVKESGPYPQTICWDWTPASIWM